MDTYNTRCWSLTCSRWRQVTPRSHGQCAQNAAWKLAWSFRIKLFSIGLWTWSITAIRYLNRSEEWFGILHWCNKISQWGWKGGHGQKYCLLKHYDKCSEKYLFPKQYHGGSNRSFKLWCIEKCGWSIEANLMVYSVSALLCLPKSKRERTCVPP